MREVEPIPAPRLRRVKYLLLLWTQDVPEGQDYAEGFGGDADYQAWMDFEARVRESGAYLDSGELEPARSAVMVAPTLAGPAPREQPDPTAGTLHISGFYLVDVPDLA
ncbi:MULTISPECIES: hypothetical protein [unclassified Arthrobacter]|uniref:hypothetical protein n=1 Tax=unclassified Arthrobacter TaxID=235627 RepID=UPI0014918991|nr:MULTISPECIES: hypothetical protein [unclassified Arthrobacter]NOJ63382.1 hypothetical protein [Arthrobacter sp. 147(2020)]